MNWFESRGHHSSLHHHEILVNGHWIKKRNEDHADRNTINPQIKEMREIDVYEPTATDLILNRLSIALSNPNLDPYNFQYAENFHIIGQECIPYTFFETENYEVKFFDVNKRLLETMIYISPDSQEELRKDIKTDIKYLIKKWQFLYQKNNIST